MDLVPTWPEPHPAEDDSSHKPSFYFEKLPLVSAELRWIVLWVKTKETVKLLKRGVNGSSPGQSGTKKCYHDVITILLFLLNHSLQKSRSWIMTKQFEPSLKYIFQIIMFYLSHLLLVGVWVNQVQDPYLTMMPYSGL